MFIRINVPVYENNNEPDCVLVERVYKSVLTYYKLNYYQSNVHCTRIS